MPRRAPDLALVVAVFASGAIGCGDDPARVSVAIVGPADNRCSHPMGARNVRITAYGASEKRVSVAPNEGIDIADFPSDTEQLSIEVEVGGGAVGAAGKTAPFDFLALDDGVTLPIFLAPPNGFCPTAGAMNVARIAPVAARAGDGVLVVGGHDAANKWTATAEYYDPMTSTFESVVIPDLFDDPIAGFAGISLATMPDGRVAMSGGAFKQIAIFDPATREFVSSESIEGRAYHTSIALDADHVLVAGGCPALDGAACPDMGEPRRSSKIYDLADIIHPVTGPNLRISRLGSQVFDIGVQRDGQRGFVIAGGTPPINVDPEGADSIVVGDANDGFAIGNVHAQAAALDGGGVLTVFELDGATMPSGAASVIVPGQDTARGITAAFARDGARVVGLEDGRVLGIGGDADGGVIVYDPTTDRWQTVMPDGEPPAGKLTAPTLLRLADGSVLVLGSPINGEASTGAWIYRPSIVGPAIGSMNVLPLDEATGVLTPEDPSTVVRVLQAPQSWTLVGGDAMARALVGGPRRTAGSVTASVRVTAGGMALIGQQTGPGRAILGILTEGSPSRIVRLDGGQERVLCTGRNAPPLVHIDMTNTTATLEISGGTARLSVETTVLASCDVDVSERGAWGVAALAESSVTVAQVTVTR